MYLKSAVRALAKIYYHLMQIGNVDEFKLDEEESENRECEFKANQLSKITGNLREVAYLYEYLGREVLLDGKLVRGDRGIYKIDGSDIFYKYRRKIEYYDKRINNFNISTVGYNGTDYYIVGYPLPMQDTKVRVRGYKERRNRMSLNAR